MSAALKSKARIDALLAAANTVIGGEATDLTTAVGALIAGFGQGGSGGMKVTEYVVTEDADRSLWLNEQKIKLVKGVNIIAIAELLNGASTANNRTGLTTIIMIFWRGTSGNHGGTMSSSALIKGFYACTNGYNVGTNFNQLCVGNTSAVSVDEDGLLTFTTSATGVTTGNYNNSFIGAGNTYYLLQAESEAVY